MTTIIDVFDDDDDYDEVKNEDHYDHQVLIAQWACWKFEPLCNNTTSSQI